MPVEAPIVQRIALVAGGTGLTGRALLQLLLKGSDYARIHAITRRPVMFDNPRLANRVLPLEQVQAKLAGTADIAGLDAYAKAKVVKAFKLAIDPQRSPRIDAAAHPRRLARLMFAQAPQSPAVPLRPGDTLKPLEENSRWKALAAKQRAGLAGGKPLPESKAVSYRDALFEGIIAEFYRDARLIAYGEENRDWDGAFGVYRGMTESFPYHRLFNTPISEAAIIGSAVGYALEGGRALVELMYADFLGRGRPPGQIGRAHV